MSSGTEQKQKLAKGGVETFVVGPTEVQMIVLPKSIPVGAATTGETDGSGKSKSPCLYVGCKDRISKLEAEIKNLYECEALFANVRKGHISNLTTMHIDEMAHQRGLLEDHLKEASGKMSKSPLDAPFSVVSDLCPKEGGLLSFLSDVEMFENCTAQLERSIWDQRRRAVIMVENRRIDYLQSIIGALFDTGLKDPSVPKGEYLKVLSVLEVLKEMKQAATRRLEDARADVAPASVLGLTL